MPKKKRQQETRRDCYFCKTESKPYWRDYDQLKNYLSGRSRILSRSKTGVCARHQRRLAQAIKRARHLGLLPYVTKVK